MKRGMNQNNIKPLSIATLRFGLTPLAVSKILNCFPVVALNIRKG